MEKAIVKLNDIMTDIVDKNVIAYKTDLQYDFELLRDKEQTTNKYYWLVRDTGTDMLPYPSFLIDGTFGLAEARYHKASSLIYEINVSKRCSKNIYGSIRKISLKEFEKLLENPIHHDEIESVDILVYFKDQDGKRNKKNINLPFSLDLFFDIIKKLNISREQYEKRYETINFIKNF